MRTALSFAAGLLVVARAAAGMTPEEKCTAQRLGAVGRYAQCRLSADAHGVRTSEAASYTTCDDKFDKKWKQVEARGGGACLVVDGAGIRAAAATATGDLANAVAGQAISRCGNGILEVGEDCDLGTLGGASCANSGYAGGLLDCGAGCALDTSACWTERFVDNHDGTITDNLVRLMWEKKVGADGTADGGAPHDADNQYRWSGACAGDSAQFCQPDADAAALCLAHADGGTAGCGECGAAGPCLVAGSVASATIWSWAASLNASAFAGHTDWRIPTRAELDSLFDHTGAGPVDPAFSGMNCGPSCVAAENADCSCWPGDAAWSATATLSGPPFAAWWVGPFGSLAINGQATAYRVWAVRRLP